MHTHSDFLNPDRTPCGLVCFADDGHLLGVSQGLREMLGWPLQGWPQRSFEQLLNPSSRIYQQMVLGPTLRLHGHAQEVSLVLQAADGRSVHVLGQFRREATDQGMLTRGALLPLHRRKQLEDQLLQSQRTADELPGVLFRLMREADGRWRLPYAGKGMAELTGLDLHGLFEDAEPLFASMHDGDRAALHALLDLSVDTLHCPPITVRAKPPHKGLRWLRAHMAVHPQSDGAVVWQGALYDVTQQQLIEQRLREHDKLHAIAVLAAGVAHDFNNLLGSISGLAELCQLEAAEGSRQARNLDRIVLASTKAAGLVRQLLDFSRQTPQQPEVLCWSQLLARSRSLIAASLPPQVELQLQVLDDCTVRVDAAQIEQCLLNLVNNAAHAMRQRGGCVRLLADVAPEPEGRPRERARLRVADEGEGIPLELQKRVFEPFFTTKPVGEGTGLGLAAVHGIVVQHGGEIHLHSVPGQGTEFTLLLPRACADTSTPPAPPHLLEAAA